MFSTANIIGFLTLLVLHFTLCYSSIRSGILDTRRMLDMGMKIGLGTGESDYIMVVVWIAIGQEHEILATVNTS